jgi:hypothetical protein
MKGKREYWQILKIVVCASLVSSCQIFNSFVDDEIEDNTIPSFVSSTLKNANYLGGSTHIFSSRYIDGQENVNVPGQAGLKATFYNFGFWEGDEIELPLGEIDAMWHNNDYANNIRNATQKWIVEYSLYYLVDGTAYCECRYKLRINAPINGNWYCYSEIIYIGSIDISSQINEESPINSNLAIITTAIQSGEIIAYGSRDDYIVKVKENEQLISIASQEKKGMFYSIDPFPYIEIGYMLINVVPVYREYRILDPQIVNYSGDWYAAIEKY